MRKIIVSEFLSLDGVMEGPGPDDSFEYAGWTMSYSDADAMKFKEEELMASDALLLGRVTYEGFAKAWPNMKDTGSFGEKMNSMTKHVVSTTLENADWNNSQIIKDNIVEEIAKLKQQDGKDILVAGSSILLKTLLENNLVDEFNLLVYPVVLGSGKQLFKQGTHSTLNLLETRIFSDVTLLRYKVNKL